MEEKQTAGQPQHGCFFCNVAGPQIEAMLDHIWPETTQEHFRNARIEMLKGYPKHVGRPDRAHGEACSEGHQGYRRVSPTQSVVDLVNPVFMLRFHQHGAQAYDVILVPLKLRPRLREKRCW